MPMTPAVLAGETSIPEKRPLPRYLVGTSLKMYFDHARTVEWTGRVAQDCGSHPLLSSGTAGVFLMPQFPSIPACLEAAGPLLIGAQNLAARDVGAWTGEVSGAVLSELGCRLVEVGHAERRRHFGETDEVVHAKVHAALRNDLVPVLCVGETEATPSDRAAAAVFAEVDSALRGTTAPVSVVLAYEPVWAIGAPRPASAEHIRTVCRVLRERVSARFPNLDLRIIYGGSAGPGLLTEIGTQVDGLFLGRFAHDPAAISSILDELSDLLGDRT